MNSLIRQMCFCGRRRGKQSGISVANRRPNARTCVERRSGFSLTGQGNKKTILVFSLLAVAIFAAFPSIAIAESTLMQLRSQSRELLREHAMADDSAIQHQLLTALCDLYVVLRSDNRYRQSEMLQQDAGKIRRRLLTAAGQIKARLRHKKVVRPTELGHMVDEALERSFKNGKSKSSSNVLSPSKVAANPPQAMAAGGIADNGWQLVELIERVVAPDFWETNGGPGTIQYFAMRRILVVRATSDVHEQIRDLLLALPR